jgi:hypothetical protein
LSQPRISQDNAPCSGVNSHDPARHVSLGVLRAYLIAMTLMLGYRVLDLAGMLHKIR